MENIRPLQSGPLRNLKNLLIAIAILAVMLPGTVACDSGKPHAAHSTPARTSSPAPKPTTKHPHCELQVVKTGFSIQYGEGNAPKRKRDGNVFYGALVRNPCKDTALSSDVGVVAVNGAYRSSDDDPADVLTGSTRRIPELLPGRTVGLCGILGNDSDYDATKVAKIRLRVGTARWNTRSSSKPQTVRAEHVVLGSRDAKGRVPITFQLDMSGELKYSWMSIITLDGADRIVAGENREIDDGGGAPGGTVHTSVWTPPRTKGLHVEIFFVTDSYM